MSSNGWRSDIGKGAKEALILCLIGCSFDVSFKKEISIIYKIRRG
jgi:hypothetical protein